MISIIIPTYQEHESLDGFLKYLIANSSVHIHEIIVVDATNCNLTRQITKANGCLFLTPGKGRAVQMNAGAKKANGEVLYFLHADSYPPKHFDLAIMESIEQHNGAGCFYMGFDSKHPVLKASGWLTRFGSNWCRGGDQSLYIKKSLFKEIGGFNETCIILEDSEIIPRIKKETKFKVIPQKLTTSARRYRDNGVFRLQLLFGIIHVGYRMGISQNSLLEFYKKHIN